MRSKTKAGVKDIRERVSFLRAAMLDSSLDSMEQSQTELKEAAEWLALLKEELALNPLKSASDKDVVRQELERLRADLARVSRLSSHGLEFCRQWGYVLQSAAGYLPNGEGAPYRESTTMVIRG